MTIQNRNSGWLVKKGNVRAKLGDFDDRFVHYITEVHHLHPGLFSVGMMMDMFSTCMSMRRGAVLETPGQVDEIVIKLMNRWRTKESTKGTTPGLSMQQKYSQVRDVF